METKIYIITDKEKKGFKSYYVVWKLQLIDMRYFGILKV